MSKSQEIKQAIAKLDELSLKAEALEIRLENAVETRHKMKELSSGLNEIKAQLGKIKGNEQNS